MNVSEIRDNCIESAASYLNFMEKNEKGYEEVDVSEIKSGHNNIFQLRLLKRLFNTESISFKDIKNDKVYDTSEVKIVEYDPDTNLLIVKPEKNLIPVISKLKPNEIKIISDLKFLVKNLKEWYETNGMKIKLPGKASELIDSYPKIKFLDQLIPSITQKESIKSIFENPFSYVWGAPGTGKTQFVLAYSALHYINEDKRVGIFAATNNALEQVLRGVIKMTDKAGIARNKILRLGNPTGKFAEEYPEVCEERGILKALKETEEKIDRVNRVLNYAENVKKIRELDLKLSDIEKLNILKEFKNNSENLLSESKVEYAKLQSKILESTANLKRSEDKLVKLNRKKNSLLSKLRRAVSKNDLKVDKSIIEETNNLEKYKDELADLKVKSELSKLKMSEFESQIQKTIADSEMIISDLMETIKQIKNYSSISKSLNLDNFHLVKTELEKFIKSEKERLNIDESFYNEYKGLTKEQIEIKIKELEKEKENVLKTSPEGRLQNVNIVASTLDTYIGRFKNKQLDINHIFLDEAGYANIVKSLTLFTNDVPVTFLGDHMQLPPVCEISDMDIQKKSEYFNMYLWAQSSLFLESLFSKTNEEMRKQYLENDPPQFNIMKRTSLISTFRFGHNLAKILDNKVYKIGLTSSSSNNQTVIKILNGKKNEDPKSRESLNEGNAIKKYTDTLNNNDFIILAPYKNQVKLLGRLMPQFRNQLKILTVHGSQGREWDIVILSVVDTGDKWFVDSTNKLSNGLKLLNTAVSRARKELVIVCDENYWKNQNGQLLKDFINLNGKDN